MNFPYALYAELLIFEMLITLTFVASDDMGKKIPHSIQHVS